MTAVTYQVRADSPRLRTCRRERDGGEQHRHVQEPVPVGVLHAFLTVAKVGNPGVAPIDRPKALKGREMR